MYGLCVIRRMEKRPSQSVLHVKVFLLNCPTNGRSHWISGRTVVLTTNMLWPCGQFDIGADRRQSRAIDSGCTAPMVHESPCFGGSGNGIQCVGSGQLMPCTGVHSLKSLENHATAMLSANPSRYTRTRVPSSGAKRIGRHLSMIHLERSHLTTRSHHDGRVGIVCQ